MQLERRAEEVVGERSSLAQQCAQLQAAMKTLEQQKAALEAGASAKDRCAVCFVFFTSFAHCLCCSRTIEQLEAKIASLRAVEAENHQVCSACHTLMLIVISCVAASVGA